jgi:uncharacterized protein involved in exopolysaccharide biosynthesis
MPQEFSPKDEIQRMLHMWWVLAACMILGGLVGFAVHRVEPPVYQAKATLYSFIDFQKVTDVRLSEYDEDVTINTIQSVMLSNLVIGKVLENADNAGIPMDYTTFMDQMSIYRSLTNYELFYRDRNPKVARTIVNIWAQTGLSTLKELQAAGAVPPYITVELQNLAEQPQSPSYSQTNSYVLSGAVLGLVAGLLASSSSFPISHKKRVTGKKAKMSRLVK